MSIIRKLSLWLWRLLLGNMGTRPTKFVFLQGKAKWAKLVTPDTKFNRWGIVLYMDKASLDIFNEMKKEGVKNVLKKDEDGYHAQFSRPCSKLIRGKVIGFAPPEVLESDGKSVLRNALVGNGSDVTIKLEQYWYKTPIGEMESAVRLLSVRVDTLVPFEMSKDFDEDQLRAVKNLDKQPPQVEQPF